MKPRLLTAAVLIAGAGVAVTACGPSGGAASHVPTAFTPSAIPSSVIASAKADAESLIGNCLPKSNGQYTIPASVSALQAAMKCAEVPKGSRVKVAACLVTDAAKGPIPPAGPDRDNAILTWAVSCIRISQGGATASPSAATS